MRLAFLLGLLLVFISGCDRPTDVNNTDDGLPPGVPEGLRIYFAREGEIIIDWILSREPDIKHYNVYRSTDSINFSFLDYTADDYYIDDSLSYDTTYFYKITVEDIYNRESSFTNVVSAKPVNKNPPRTPLDLAINARNWSGEKSVVLNWTPNDETDLAGYKIFRGENSGFTADSSSLVGTINDIEFKDTTVQDFYKIYYYRIRAFDKGGLESNPSYEVYDQIFEEPVLITPDQNSIVYNFSEFVFKGTGAAARYKLIVQENIFFGELWQTDISSTTPYDTIKVPVPGGIFFYNTNYYWRVAAYSGSQQPNSITPLYKFIIKP